MVQEKHALLIAVFHSGEDRGLGRPGRAMGTYPVNSVLCIVYFFTGLNVTGVNTIENNKNTLKL